MHLNYDIWFFWEDEDWTFAGRNGHSRRTGALWVLSGILLQKPETGRILPNYRELLRKIIEYVKGWVYLHRTDACRQRNILDGSWGYQVIGYYAPTARYGNAEDFMFFMNEMHKAGIGVISTAPAYFPWDTYGLSALTGHAFMNTRSSRQALILTGDSDS